MPLSAGLGPHLCCGSNRYPAYLSTGEKQKFNAFRFLGPVKSKVYATCENHNNMKAEMCGQ